MEQQTYLNPPQPSAERPWEESYNPLHSHIQHEAAPHDMKHALDIGDMSEVRAMFNELVVVHHLPRDEAAQLIMTKAREASDPDDPVHPESLINIEEEYLAIAEQHAELEELRVEKVIHEMGKAGTRDTVDSSSIDTIVSSGRAFYLPPEQLRKHLENTEL